MKKFLIYIWAGLLAAGFCSCDPDFLNLSDPDSFDVPKFYQTEEDMNDALSAVYQATRRFYNQMFFVTEMKSDNASTTATGVSSGLYYNFPSYNVSSTNTIVANVWNGLAYTINRSNWVLRYLDGVEFADEAERERIRQETYFLRALANFYLVRLYGEVPVVNKVLETTSEVKALKRQPVEQVYGQIIADLQPVADGDVLPAFIAADDADFGRATNTAAAALLGKVYLTMAATLGNDAYYDDAITYLQRACTLRGYTELGTTFPRVFGVANEGNEEIIFQCMYLEGNEDESSAFAYYFQPLSVTGVTSQAQGRGFNSGEENLFNEYEEGDRRKSTSIVEYGNTYYTRKYSDMTNALGYGGNNWIELRFADVFLMLAEAYERTNNEDLAKDYLDRVRSRAELPGYDESDAAYHAAYPTLREAIFHERRMELAFENHRWFDLQRLYPTPELLNEYMHRLATDYPRFNAFHERDFLLPIPFDEVHINPEGMYQNEGY